MMAEDLSKIFAGVNFVLHGFDFITQEKIRLRLIEGGGVDVGRYGPDCTHLIVDKIPYDDPICKAARTDGKTLVTGLWVEHSLDAGMPVEPTSVMYTPLRDINGIPGAKSLVICLTGYLRQDRDDVMTMVGLMGATFSKPLVANTVTHLICYKFEGDKYELAKKLKKIKLVNHRWLEDCLRAWKLLPEADYDKSGYELELMEAQAKDSEDEAENMEKMQPSERGIVVTPQSSRYQARSPSQLFTLKERASTNTFDSSIPRASTDVNANSIQHKEVHNNSPDMPGPVKSESGGKICNSASKLFSKSPLSEFIRKDKKSPALSSPKIQSVTNSRQSPKKSCHTLEREQSESYSERHLEVDMGKNCIGHEFDLSSLEAEGEVVTLVKEGKSPLIKARSPPGGKQHSVTPVKRSFADSCGGFELVKRSESPGLIPKCTSVTKSTEISQAKSLVNGQPMVSPIKFTNFASPDLIHQHPSKLQSPCVPENVQECSEKALKTSSATTKSANVGDKMLRAADGFRLPEGSFTNAMKPKDGLQAEDVRSPENKGVGVKDLDVNPDIDLVTEVDNSGSKPKRRKLLAKKTLGSRPSLGRGKALNTKGSIYMMEKDPVISNAWTSIGNMDLENNEDFGNFDNFTGITSTSIAEKDMNTDIEKIAISVNEAPLEMGERDDETESPGNNDKSESDNTVSKGNSGSAVIKSASDTTMKPIDSRCPNTKGHLMISCTDDETALVKNSTLMDNSDEMKTPSGEKGSIEPRKMDFTPVIKGANSGKDGSRKTSKRKMDTGETETKNRKRVPLAERGKKLDSPEKTSEQNDNRHSNLEDQAMASSDKEIAFEAGSVASGSRMEPKDSSSAKTKNRKRVPLAKRGKKLDSSEKTSEQNDIRHSNLGDQAMPSADKEMTFEAGSVASGNKMEPKDPSETKNRKKVPLAKRGKKLDSSEKTSEQIDNRCSNLDQAMASADEEIVIEPVSVASGNKMELIDSTFAETKDRKRATVVKRDKKLDSKKTSKKKDSRCSKLDDQVTVSADEEIVTETRTIASGSKLEQKDPTSAETKNRKSVTVAKRGKKLDSKKTSEKNDNRPSNLVDQVLASVDEETVIEAGPVASGNKMQLKDSTFADNAVEEKTISEQQCSDVTKISNDPPMQETTSITAAPKKASKLKTSDAKKETKNTKRSQLAKRDKKAADLGQSSLQGGEENMPVSVGDQSVNPNKQQLQKLTPNSCKKFTKSITGDHSVVLSPSITNSSKKSVKSLTGDQSVVSSALVPSRRLEPAWFILSGHRLQRKEFQKVIKHLKGRLCRDTHQWSYQATHFIVSDPVRRTEKFFAAAASGRWILKTDYLTASNEAGKFLPEEPFEWHKNGLSEDGAINLIAPRKWRTLRERTGHGAFYGMRVVIYGDCIAPPLETLKRVIKSGDGTLLATSPPYSRFLESGVDYAIVSPGMPRVDIWVQEFLRHEVPCIVADYLVDFVCKPGYSLEKHVQYNTKEWAEKSFKKMVENMENIADDWRNPEDNNSNSNNNNDNSDDIACQACGSCERGDVMLICGDENGSSGCGVGMHIDCCDPPLDEIPEEDWFCTKCSSKSKKGKTKKKTRKGT